MIFHGEMGLGNPVYGHECHVGDLHQVPRLLKRMIECGLRLPQVIPRVNGVFRCKSLGDVILEVGILYLFLRLEKLVIGYQFFWEVHLCEDCWDELMLACLLCWCFETNLGVAGKCFVIVVWFRISCEIVLKVACLWGLNENSTRILSFRFFS